MAIRSVSAQIIETPQNEIEKWLVSQVSEQAKSSGIETPQFAIFLSPKPLMRLLPEQVEINP